VQLPGDHHFDAVARARRASWSDPRRFVAATIINRQIVLTCTRFRARILTTSSGSAPFVRPAGNWRLICGHAREIKLSK